MVKPAYRITTVAVPTKNIEPRWKSGFSFLLGRVKSCFSGTGSPRGGRGLQLLHDPIEVRKAGPAQGTQPLEEILRRPVIFGCGGEIFLACRITDAIQITCYLIGVDAHDSLLSDR